MRAGLALIVLVLDFVALFSLLGARIDFGRKLAWSAAIVLLPFAGAAGWLWRGRTRQREARQTTYAEAES